MTLNQNNMLNLYSFAVPAERYNFLPTSVFLACGVINLGGTLGEIFMFIAKFLAYLSWKAVLTFLLFVTDFLTNMLKTTSNGKVYKDQRNKSFAYYMCFSV